MFSGDEGSGGMRDVAGTLHCARSHDPGAAADDWHGRVSRQPGGNQDDDAAGGEQQQRCHCRLPARNDSNSLEGIVQFLPHDAMLARYMLSSLSVYLSVTLRYCIKMAKCRITQIMPHESPGTLVFWCQRSWRNSNGKASCFDCFTFFRFPSVISLLGAAKKFGVKHPAVIICLQLFYTLSENVQTIQLLVN